MMAGNGFSSTSCAPRGLVVSGLGLVEPTLDVLAGGARVVARRQSIDVDGTFDAPRSRVVRPTGPDVERDGEGRVHQALTSCDVDALVDESVALDVRVGDRLDASDDVGSRVLAEEVREAPLEASGTPRRARDDGSSTPTSPCRTRLRRPGRVPSPWRVGRRGSSRWTPIPNRAGRERARADTARRGTAWPARPCARGRAGPPPSRWRRRRCRAPSRCAAGPCPDRRRCRARGPRRRSWRCVPPAASPPNAGRRCSCSPRCRNR